MQLLGFYIRDFEERGIENQFVNLSSEFLIDVEEIDNKNFNIVIDRNPDYIDNFFDKDNIKDVSVIVGKNGAGKSSILYYILNNFNTGNYSARKDSFFILLNDNTIYIDNYYIKIKKDNVNIKVKGYNFTLINDDYLNFISENYINNLTNIYYNYFLNRNTDIKNMGGIEDISTMYLIHEDTINNPIVTNLNINPLDLLNQKDFLKEFQFVTSDFRNSIKFKLPDKYFIKLLDTDYKILLNSKNDFDVDGEKPGRAVSNSKKERNNCKKYIDDLKKLISDDSIESFKQLFNINIILNILNSIIIYTQRRNDRIRFPKVNTNKTVFENIFLLININSVYIPSETKDLILKINELLNSIIGSSLFREVSKKEIILNNRMEDYDNIKQFLEMYKHFSKFNNPIEFSWHSLSTGEQSFLTLMARTYSISADKDKEIKKNVLFLIDEGDVGFHPKWQQEFFNISINFINEIFNHRNVQIIYTTNAPYMLSDVPKNYVTFIEKDKDKKVKIHGKQNNFEQTFAQNIHTLLSGSFFLDNGLIGDFAKNKINKVIDFINDNKNFKENYNEEEIENNRKIINLIGEPIIRNKLNSMLNNQIGEISYI